MDVYYLFVNLSGFMPLAGRSTGQWHKKEAGQADTPLDHRPQALDIGHKLIDSCSVSTVQPLR